MIQTELMHIRSEYNFNKRELYFILDYLIDHPAIINNAILTEKLELPCLIIQEKIPQIVYKSNDEEICDDIRMIWKLQKHFNRPFYLKINRTLSEEEKEKKLAELMQQIDQAIDSSDEALFIKLTKEIQNIEY